MNPEAKSAASDDGSTRAAATVLHRIFRRIEPGVQFRLWDGSIGRVGNPDGSFTIALASVRDPKVRQTHRSIRPHSTRSRAMCEMIATRHADARQNPSRSARINGNRRRVICSEGG